MSIITVSRGSYSRGKEIAEKLAQRLDYKCISRDSLFDNVDELDARDVQLVSSIEDIPSIFSRFRKGKETYIAYIRATLLQKLKSDNVVYEGFVGHVFLEEIPGILKVRINSDEEDRSRIVAERDGLSIEQATKFIRKIDTQRRKWSQYLYGIDPSDSNQYDIVLNVAHIPPDSVIDTLVRISRLEQFRLTDEARQQLDNLALAAEIQNRLLRNYSGVNVTADDGKVSIQSAIPRNERSGFISELERMAREMPPVKMIELAMQLAVPLSRERVEESLVITP
jgi:cytidylate kinase